MIDTKEEYQEALSKTNSTVRECIETIEALRKVARAVKMQHFVPAGEMVDALPKWLVEDA